MERSFASLIRIVLCFAAALSACAKAADTPAAPDIPTAPAAQNNIETLVFVRHAEKPPTGLGQLSCKGLNRALALPAVIAAKYGKPDAIYAPDPGERKNDSGQPYYYVRPLATIEPTAIQFGLPVQTPYGFSQIGELGGTLIDPKWANRTVLVAWEHREIEELARQIVGAHGGAAGDVPSWKSNDFDSIYVVRIDWSGGTPRARFSREHEDLDDRADDCPCAALPPAR
ncbi:histidine phosphatase family protein [Paraburkholderia sp.]|uniref:histidine phosphatase family protein n=1 Tax=Paraburkholderia sp. TaxID=1926495 RepID=UPI0025D6D83C|nr:histidine phosphatase family protein [Paraburkholderia sp.]